MSRVYFAFFATYFFTTSILLYLLSLLLLPITLILDKRRRLLHRIASAWGYHFVRLNRRWKCRFENKSKFKSDKTYVVVANHQSIADTFFLSGLARPFKWVSKESLFKLPFFGWNMHLTRYISIKRGDARQTAGAAAEQPDLIMLDVRMPVWDGPETLEHLKRNPLTEHIPVILMTASVQQAELEQYEQLDVIGVIDKPFDPLLLPRQIRQMAANARA